MISSEWEQPFQKRLFNWDIFLTTDEISAELHLFGKKLLYYVCEVFMQFAVARFRFDQQLRNAITRININLNIKNMARWPLQKHGNDDRFSDGFLKTGSNTAVLPTTSG